MASLVLGAVGGMMFGPVGYLVGSFIGSLLGPQSKQEGPRLKNLHLHGSEYGKMIPIIYGSMRTAGQVDFQTDLKEHKHESGGKGGPRVTTYTYTATFSVKICEGPMESVGRIWANGTLIYDPTGDTAGLPEIPITIYLGSTTQMPDPSLEAELGVGNVSANRGYVYAVFTEWDLGEYGNAIPNLNFEVHQRGTSGNGQITRIAQNYDMEYEYYGPAITQWTRTGNSIHVTEAFNGLPQPDPRSPRVLPYQTMTYAPDLTYTGPGGGTPNDYYPVSFTLCNDFGVAIGYSWFYQAVGMYQVTDEIVLPLWVRQTLNNYIVYPTPMGISVNTSFPMLGSSDMYSSYEDTGGFLEYPKGKEYATDFGLDPGLFIFGGALSQNRRKLYLFTAPVYNGSMDTWWEIINGELARSGTIDPPLPAMSLGYGGTSGNYGNTVSCSMENNGQYLWTYAANSQGPLGQETGGVVQVYEIDDTGNLAINTVCGYAGAGGPGGLTFAGRGTVKVLSTGYAGIVRGDGRLAIFTRLTSNPGTVQLFEIINDISERCGLDVATQVNSEQQTQVVDGYMLDKQMDGRSGINQLQPIFYFDGVERAGKVTFVNRGQATEVVIQDRYLAAMARGSGEAPPLVGVKRMQEVDLPCTFIVNFVNGANDYQAGSQYARRLVTRSQAVLTLEIPVNMTNEYAAGVAWANLTAAWMERTKTEIRVPRKYWVYEPTDVITAHGYTTRTISKSDNPVGILTLTGVVTNPLTWVQGPTTGGGGGFTPSLPAPKSEATGLLLDIPLVIDPDFQFGKYFAAAAKVPTTPFGGATLYESSDGGASYTALATINAASIVGTANDALGDWPGGNMFDEVNHVEVTLTSGGSLVSYTKEAVLNGEGAYLIGDEELRACVVEEVSTGVWRLSSLLRGRRGTEWAMGAHAAGERFVALPTAANVDGALSDLGNSRLYKIVGTGYSLASAEAFSFTNNGAAARPYSPVHVGGAPIDPFDGTVYIHWTRRTRVGGAWNNFVNVPLSEATEEYIVQVWDATFTTCARIASVVVPDFTYTAAMQIADFGAIQESVYVTVGQVGAYRLGIQTPAVIPGLGSGDDAPLNPVPPYNSSPPPPTGGCSLPVQAGVLDWTAPNVRVLNAEAGPDAVWVLTLVTGAVALPGVGKINVAEYGGPPVLRVATISETPCGAPLGGAFYSSAGGTAPLIFFAMSGYNASPSQYPTLLPSTTYYVSVTSAAPSGASALLQLPS